MKKILISACLLGIPCRYDGRVKNKLDDAILTKLRERYDLIPVCPEIYGGLPTPREKSERVGDLVVMEGGRDVTENFKRGAEAALELARILNCRAAVLKERSPSCGRGEIYSGKFDGGIKSGDGVTAELLLKNGISVFGESEIFKII